MRFNGAACRHWVHGKASTQVAVRSAQQSVWAQAKKGRQHPRRAIHYLLVAFRYIWRRSQERLWSSSPNVPESNQQVVSSTQTSGLDAKWTAPTHKIRGNVHSSALRYPHALHWFVRVTGTCMRLFSISGRQAPTASRQPRRMISPYASSTERRPAGICSHGQQAGGGISCLTVPVSNIWLS